MKTNFPFILVLLILVFSCEKDDTLQNDDTQKESIEEPDIFDTYHGEFIVEGSSYQKDSNGTWQYVHTFDTSTAYVDIVPHNQEMFRMYIHYGDSSTTGPITSHKDSINQGEVNDDDIMFHGHEFTLKGDSLIYKGYPYTGMGYGLWYYFNGVK